MRVYSNLKKVFYLKIDKYFLQKMGVNLSCCLPQSWEQVSVQQREKISRNRWCGICSSLLFSCSKNSLSLSGRPRLLCSLFHGFFGESRRKATWHLVNEFCSDKEGGVVLPLHCQSSQIAKQANLLGKGEEEGRLIDSPQPVVHCSFQKKESGILSLATYYREKSGRRNQWCVPLNNTSLSMQIYSVRDHGHFSF